MVAEESFLGSAINLLVDIGVYRYVLPFLLVFTILYAIFEKTKVLGTEKVEGTEYPRRNLNAMVSFVIALLVIVSKEVVPIITTTSVYVVVLLLAAVFFMLLAGSFHEEKDKPFFLEKPWSTIFMWIMFIGLIGIFSSAMKTKSGKSWLMYVIDWLKTVQGEKVLSVVVLLSIIIGFMYFVTKEPRPKKKEG